MDQGNVGDLTKDKLIVCLSQLLDQKLARLAIKDYSVELANKVDNLMVEKFELRENDVYWEIEMMCWWLG